MLQDARRLTVELSDYAKGLKGIVRVHSNTSALTQFLPEQLVSFSTRFPEVRVDIEERRSSEIVQAVSLGTADVGIIVNRPPTDGLETFAYRSDDLVAVVPKNAPLRRRRVAFDELLDFDFACLESRASITRTLLQAAAAANRPLRMRVQVWSSEAMCRMVQAGLGVGVLPRKAAETYSVSLGLRLVSLSDAWARREHLVCVKALKALPVHGRRFVEHLIHVQ